MEMLGLKPGRPWAVLAGLSEFGGGVLTLLGLLNPLGSLGVIGSMAMASATAHRDKPIWVTAGGAEPPVTNIAAATAVMLNGLGKYSLDRALGTRLPGWITPIGLIVIILSIMYARSGAEAPPEQDEAREELAGEEE
jgi:putative oxidoreductase